MTVQKANWMGCFVTAVVAVVLAEQHRSIEKTKWRGTELNFTIQRIKWRGVGGGGSRDISSWGPRTVCFEIAFESAFQKCSHQDGISISKTFCCSQAANLKAASPGQTKQQAIWRNKTKKKRWAKMSPAAIKSNCTMLQHLCQVSWGAFIKLLPDNKKTFMHEHKLAQGRVGKVITDVRRSREKVTWGSISMLKATVEYQRKEQTTEDLTIDTESWPSLAYLILA